MARRLVDAKPLSEPMLQYCKFIPWEIVIDIYKFSFKITFEYVGILSRPLCVNTTNEVSLIGMSPVVVYYLSQFSLVAR